MNKLTQKITTLGLPLVLSLAFTPSVQADPDYVCFIQLPGGEFVDLEHTVCGQRTSEQSQLEAQPSPSNISRLNLPFSTLPGESPRVREYPVIEYNTSDSHWVRAIQSVQHGAGQSGSFNNPYLTSSPRRNGIVTGGFGSGSSVSSGGTSGDVRVRGYYRDDGTYVRPHTRSRPNR